MPFFEPRPPTDPFIEEWDEPWLAAADRYVGGTVPASFVLAQGDDVAVVVDSLTIDPLGLSLRLTVVERRAPLTPDGGAGSWAFAARPDPEEAGLRFGLGLVDGQRVELDPRGWDEGTEGGHHLEQLSGNQEGGRSDQVLRLVPAPPPGPIVLAIAWPERGIEEIVVEVPAELVAAAQASAVLLWPEDPLPDPDEGGGWVNVVPGDAGDADRGPS